MAKAIQLPSGSWHIKVYSHTEPDGTRKYEPFTDPDKNMVEYLAAEFKLNKKRKAHIRNWTVGEAIDGYIASKDGILSPPTIQGYKKDRKNHLQDLIPVQLKDLTRDRIQNEINKECKKISSRTGKLLSSKTIANIHGLLSAALDMYYPDFVLKTTLPAKKKRLVELPEPEDVMKLIYGTEIELPCLLAMWLSYSSSEIRGIKISAISDDWCLEIKEVIVDVDGKPLSKAATKEYERTRKAKIPPYIVDLIKRQETYIRAKEAGIDGYLITMSGKGMYDRFIRLQKRQKGFPHTTFHQLRHINASVMLQLGIPDKYAMERGGWATPDTLNTVYKHTFSKERKAVDKKVDAYFGKIIKLKTAK